MRDLAAVLREAAYDIESDVYVRYNWPDVHPTMQLKFDRDMDIVAELRAHANAQGFDAALTAAAEAFFDAYCALNIADPWTMDMLRDKNNKHAALDDAVRAKREATDA